MFYEPEKQNHGLKHTPVQELHRAAADRLDLDAFRATGRVNLAPYSQFNNLGYEPGWLMFSAGGQHPDGHRKDSVINAEATGEFVYNMATYELRDAVNQTAQIIDSSIDEMRAAGLTPAPSRLVKPPRVAESPINIECTYYTTLVLPGDTHPHHPLRGGRQGDRRPHQGRISHQGRQGRRGEDRPLARLGYLDYTSVEIGFSLDVKEDVREFMTLGMSGGR